jgi:hypothetical protein
MPLTPIELRVLELFDQGKTYKQIADLLSISIHTAREYCRRIIAKTFTVDMLSRISTGDVERNIRGAAHVRRSCPATICPSMNGRPGARTRDISRSKKPVRQKEARRKNSDGRSNPRSPLPATFPVPKSI